MDVVKKFGRILLPLITVFDEGQKVDYKTTREVARYVVEKGYCDSVIVSGTTGEFYAMSIDERIRLFEEIKDELKDEIPLIAGTGSVFLKDVIEMNKMAEKLGYDAAMVVVPYYCHPNQEEIYRHFVEVAKNTSLPVMVYNIPLFVGVNLLPETLGRLAEIDNIVAVKDEAGVNPLQATGFIKKTGGKLVVYSGDDTMVLQVLTQGGVGVVSGGAHVVGDIIREMIDAYLSGRVDEATNKYLILADLYAAFFGPNGERENPTPLVKAAFEIVSGLPTSMPRSPLLPATSEEKEHLKKVLERMGKLPAG
ncbi:MAG: 4-hydroxy-tetrahydrodipicolinate synthase [Thermotogae bacterium]|nr:4-hydroxy-tetrahydrodipicolinate synthase [Thermotogota bacterium]